MLVFGLGLTLWYSGVAEDTEEKEKEDEEGDGGVQAIQSPKLRRVAVSPSPPAVAPVHRLRASAAVAGAPRPPFSAAATGPTGVVPRSFVRRRNDRNSGYQTLHSENASLERAHDHYHYVCFVRFSHSHSHSVSLLQIYEH